MTDNTTPSAQRAFRGLGAPIPTPAILDGAAARQFGGLSVLSAQPDGPGDMAA